MLDLCDGKLDAGTTVVADLAGGTGPTHYRFLVVAVKENVDGTGGDAGAAVHADPFVNNLCDQIAEDLESDRASLPTFSLCARLQGLRRRSNLRHTSLVPLLRNRSEEHTSELQSRVDLVCRLLLEKKKRTTTPQSRRATTTRWVKRCRKRAAPASASTCASSRDANTTARSHSALENAALKNTSRY